MILSCKVGLTLVLHIYKNYPYNTAGQLKRDIITIASNLFHSLEAQFSQLCVDANRSHKKNCKI